MTDGGEHVPSLVLTARLAQEAAEREAAAREADSLGRRQRELRRSIAEREARLAAVRDQIGAEQAEVDQMGLREHEQAGEIAENRLAMAARRWADAAPAPAEGGSDEPAAHHG